MKTIISKIALILLMYASVGFQAQGQTSTESAGIKFTVLEDGCAYVDGIYENFSGPVLTIPATCTPPFTNIAYPVAGILAINNNNITSVIFEGTRALGVSLKAFAGNTSLRTVNFKVDSLIINQYKDYDTHRNPFRGCTSLTSVNGEPVVFTEKEGVICYCAGFPATTYTLDSSRYGATISESAFEGARYLKVLNLPGVNHVKTRAFKDCTSLTTVNMPLVRQLYPGTFQGCTSLKSFVLPDDMTILQGETFDGCTSLESVTFPTPFHSIAYRAFRGCTSLKSIELPDEIASIYVQAFKDCTGLTSVVLPRELEEFGPEVFAGCTALRTITAPMPQPFEADSNVFDAATYQSATLMVPRGTRNAYASTLPWSNFRNIVEQDL